MSRGRPPLPMRPPVARFVDAADGPRQPASAKRETARGSANQIPASHTAADQASAPWGLPDGGVVKFETRLTERHHGMLRWLSEHSRRRSMHSILLDILEPGLERLVAEKRKELGL